MILEWEILEVRKSSAINWKGLQDETIALKYARCSPCSRRADRASGPEGVPLERWCAEKREEETLSSNVKSGFLSYLRIGMNRERRRREERESNGVTSGAVAAPVGMCMTLLNAGLN